MYRLGKLKVTEDDLEEGYELCPECEGTGVDNYIASNDGFYIDCEKCWGSGVLDWIDRIVGKECPYSSSTSSTSHTISSTSPKKKLAKIHKIRRREYEHENITRGRTVQRFHKVFNKFKRSM